MMLKAERIVSLIAEHRDAADPLVIAPLPDVEALRHSGSASIDLRLGTWFVSLRRARMPHLDVSDFAKEEALTRTSYVPFGDKYVLHPRTFVLAATLEWIRVPRNLAGYVIGKSSWGRKGLVIATAAGVHPGFSGCLTLELSNLGELPIAVRPGMRICQLFLHKVDSESERIDRSGFNGLRRPVLGSTKLDPVAAALARRRTDVPESDE
jgi:dCTP deaminase